MGSALPLFLTLQVSLLRAVAFNTNSLPATLECEGLEALKKPNQKTRKEEKKKKNRREGARALRGGGCSGGKIRRSKAKGKRSPRQRDSGVNAIPSMLEPPNSQPACAEEEEQRLSPPPPPPKVHFPAPAKPGRAPHFISIIINNKYSKHALNNRAAAQEELKPQPLPWPWICLQNRDTFLKFPSSLPHNRASPQPELPSCKAGGKRALDEGCEGASAWKEA